MLQQSLPMGPGAPRPCPWPGSLSAAVRVAVTGVPGGGGFAKEQEPPAQDSGSESRSEPEQRNPWDGIWGFEEVGAGPTGSGCPARAVAGEVGESSREPCAPAQLAGLNCGSHEQWPHEGALTSVLGLGVFDASGTGRPLGLLCPRKTEHGGGRDGRNPTNLPLPTHTRCCLAALPFLWAKKTSQGLPLGAGGRGQQSC